MQDGFRSHSISSSIRLWLHVVTKQQRSASRTTGITAESFPLRGQPTEIDDSGRPITTASFPASRLGNTRPEKLGSCYDASRSCSYPRVVINEAIAPLTHASAVVGLGLVEATGKPAELRAMAWQGE
jgi:hypothetical protein